MYRYLQINKKYCQVEPVAWDYGMKMKDLRNDKCSAYKSQRNPILEYADIFLEGIFRSHRPHLRRTIFLDHTHTAFSVIELHRVRLGLEKYTEKSLIY